MGNEKVNSCRDFGRSLQIRPCRYAKELDPVVLKAIVFQIDDAVGNQALGSVWIGIEYPVVIPRYKDSELCWDGGIPGEVVLQIGRIEAHAGISGTDENINVFGYVKPPIHPVCVGKSEDLMAFIFNLHNGENAHYKVNYYPGFPFPGTAYVLYPKRRF